MMVIASARLITCSLTSYEIEKPIISTSVILSIYIYRERERALSDVNDWSNVIRDMGGVGRISPALGEKSSDGENTLLLIHSINTC